MLRRQAVQNTVQTKRREPGEQRSNNLVLFRDWRALEEAATVEDEEDREVDVRVCRSESIIGSYRDLVSIPRDGELEVEVLAYP